MIGSVVITLQQIYYLLCLSLKAICEDKEAVWWHFSDSQCAVLILHSWVGDISSGAFIEHVTRSSHMFSTFVVVSPSVVA